MATESVIKDRQPSHTKDLLLLFAFPILILGIAIAVIYAPRLLAHPRYDFIYAYCPSYRCQNTFSVADDGQIVSHVNATSNLEYERTMTLRYYDVRSDSSRTISPEEALQYRLNDSSKAPDGYILVRQNDSNGFLFWGNSSDNWYLKNGAKKKKLSLGVDNSYYAENLTFLGWVKQ